MRAIVFFNDVNRRDGPWFLRGLKTGYRHCGVVVEDATGWTLIDPLSHRTEVFRMDGVALHNVARWLTELDRRLVILNLDPSSVPAHLAPIEPATCVTLVKRVLGIHRMRVQTPWQLYRYLHRIKVAGVRQ